jgi:hypothetical protein
MAKEFVNKKTGCILETPQVKYNLHPLNQPSQSHKKSEATAEPMLICFTRGLEKQRPGELERMTETTGDE